MRTFDHIVQSAKGRTLKVLKKENEMGFDGPPAKLANTKVTEIEGISKSDARLMGDFGIKSLADCRMVKSQEMHETSNVDQKQIKKLTALCRQHGAVFFDDFADIKKVKGIYLSLMQEPVAAQKKKSFENSVTLDSYPLHVIKNQTSTEDVNFENNLAITEERVEAAEPEQKEVAMQAEQPKAVVKSVSLLDDETMFARIDELAIADKAEMERLKSIKLDESSGLRPGIINAFRKYGISNADDLRHYGENELRTLPQFGVQSYIRVQEFAEANGFSLYDPKAAVEASLEPEKRKMQELKSVVLREWGFKYKGLDEIGVTTLADLASYTQEDLASVRFLGGDRLPRLLEFAENHGLVIKKKEIEQAEEAKTETAIEPVADEVKTEIIAATIETASSEKIAKEETIQSAPTIEQKAVAEEIPSIPSPEKDEFVRSEIARMIGKNQALMMMEISDVILTTPKAKALAPLEKHFPIFGAVVYDQTRESLIKLGLNQHDVRHAEQAVEDMGLSLNLLGKAEAAYEKKRAAEAEALRIEKEQAEAVRKKSEMLANMRNEYAIKMGLNLKPDVK